VSGYNWVDGVGPKADRLRRRELAWQSVETNQFGTNEFITFCDAINARPMLAVNMGTGTIQQAADLVEYCNAPTGTYWADRRATHGFVQPHDVRLWCLGNEMDGFWQIGHLEAADYGRKALEASKLMKLHDGSIETVLCGSSSHDLPSFPDWDRIALELAWESVDYHSMHYYATNFDDDTDSYLAIPVELEGFVDTAAATLRYVKSKRRSKHEVYLSWDEWQVWYKDRSNLGNWEEAPHLSEEIYNLEDALVVAQWLNLFLRRCDVLKIACVAQIVNVISWLHTSRDGLLKQTSFYPFALVSRMATGRALDVALRTPTYDTSKYGEVNVLDASATYDEDNRTAALFVVNRSRDQSVVAVIDWQAISPESVTEVWRLSGTNPKTANSFNKPAAITALPLPIPALNDGETMMELPPLSFTAIGFRQRSV
jgi:alpha-N-arabinofuranosidase